MSIERLRTDFQFAIFALFCVVAALGIAPFAVLRFVQGNALAGAVDSTIVVCLLIGLAHAWRGGDLGRISLAIVVAMAVGCVVIGRLIGLPGAMWSFPAIVANFLLVSRTWALVASLSTVVLLVFDGSPFRSTSEALMYLAAGVVTCVFAFVFAHQTQTQRRELESLASRDPLTGVANRRAMEREMHIAAEAFRRHRVPVGVAVLDLDHFKRINDEAGHEAGDQALIEFVQLVQSRCRSSDRLFRFGGEEFVLLASGVDDARLHRLVDDIRLHVAGALRNGARPVTVSIGAAVLQRGEATSEWLARADGALYEAKRAGRNRAIVAAPVAAAQPATA